MTPAEAREHLGALELFLGGVCARQWLGDHVCLAEQPRTPYGSPDELVDRGVPAGAEATGRWADIIVRALEPVTTEFGARTVLSRVDGLLRLEDFADPVHDETLRGALLGSADSQWERVHGVDVAPAKFDDKDPGDGISGGAHQAAIDLWNARRVLPPDAFHALNAGMRRRAFTVAGMAKADMLGVVHAEFGRMLERGATNVTEGPNFREFSKFVDERLKSAGWTPANPSHVETIFRTNVMSAYSAGRFAEMRQPHVLAAMPYWQIRGVDDSRARAPHRRAHGVILPANHSFWRTAYPPFGFNCRCRVCSRSRAWMQATGAKLGPTPRDLPDPGFTSGTSKLVQVPDAALERQATGAPSQPLATPAPPHSPPLVAKANELASALESGSGAVARSLLREQADRSLPGASSKDAHGRRSGANTLLANDLPAQAGADAYHDWNGEMVVAPDVKARAERAMRALASGGYDKLRPANVYLASEGDKLHELDGVRVLLHEELHGYSRATPYSYGGVGRILEEVGTELSARDIVAKLKPNLAANQTIKNGGFFRVSSGGSASFGAYYEEIKAVTNVLRQRLGLSVDEAHALIRKSHAAQVCGPGWHFNSAHQHLEAFVHGLDQTPELTQAIRADLLNLETADASIGLPSR